MNDNNKELPKWYNGTIYTEYEVVANRFTGEEVELSPNEVAMYDLIIGAEFVKDFKLMQKGLDWFRTANPSAYMILLD
jgi:hypothetical protein|tara:strand:- start:63 stop:296 length:234 start_codon:yes stop_codon:yes gene_type:complete